MPLTKITGGEFDNTQGGLSVAGIITASSDLLVSGNIFAGNSTLSTNIPGKINVIGAQSNTWSSSDTSNYIYQAYPNELQVANTQSNTTNSFASILLRAGQTSTDAQINAARIAAIRTAAFTTDLAFAVRSDANTMLEAARITSAGNFGLGKTPIAKFDIGLTGTVNIATTTITKVTDFGTSASFGFNGLTNNNDGVFFGMGAGGGNGIPAGIGFMREASGWNTALAFYTNNVTSGPNSTNAMQEKVRIDSSGNFGIGTNATVSGCKLNVSTGINCNGLNVSGLGGFFNSSNKFGVDNNSGVTRFYSSGSNSSTKGSYDFRITDSVGTLDTSAVVIDSSGNLKLSTAGTKVLNSSGNPILQQTGSILQVVQTVKSDIFSNSTKGSYVAVTGLSATITPTSTTSKILVMSEVTWDSQNNYPIFLHIYRGGAQITPNGNSTGQTPSTAYNAFQQPADTRSWLDQQTLIYLDSPASTSALTYQIYAAKPSVAASNIVINTFGSSNITLMEIAG